MSPVLNASISTFPEFCQRKIELMKNGNFCLFAATEMANFRLFDENGNGKWKFASLGRQTINGYRLLCQQTCPSMPIGSDDGCKIKGGGLPQSGHPMLTAWEPANQPPPVDITHHSSHTLPLSSPAPPLNHQHLSALHMYVQDCTIPTIPATLFLSHPFTLSRQHLSALFM
jgi:hypothetical protein